MKNYINSFKHIFTSLHKKRYQKKGIHPVTDWMYMWIVSGIVLACVLVFALGEYIIVRQGVEVDSTGSNQVIHVEANKIDSIISVFSDRNTFSTSTISAPKDPSL
jgi:hypothetical protein